MQSRPLPSQSPFLLHTKMAQEQSTAGERNEAVHCSAAQDSRKAEASLCSTLVTKTMAQLSPSFSFSGFGEADA